MPDFTFHQERMSNVCLLTPVSEDGQEWIDEHIDPDSLYFGPSIALEERYAHDILEGIVAVGLTVEAA